MGSIAATGDPRRWAMEPGGKGAGFVFAPETNCYDCPIKHTYPTCNIACADYIEHMIRNESDVAAIILEPVVGTNGVLVPPPEYFPRLREICDRHGVLMIADEVMAGWGRTGKWFAVDHWNVKPDILVTAKGITSAYVPLGLCATTTKIADYFEDHYFSHGHTYEAHPITLGPAVATIEEMQRLKLVERAAELEPYVREKLEGLKAKHRFRRRRARPRPLLCRRDREEPRKTKQPFNTMRDKVEGKPLVVDQIAAKMMAQGVSHSGLGQPLRHRAAADRDQRRARPRHRRARRALGDRRCAGGSLVGQLDCKLESQILKCFAWDRHRKGWCEYCFR
jgi:taurine---2-oxoglutarate transaminase